jgi:hypothetical protein
MSKFAKPMEALLKATPEVHAAMINYVDYLEFASELRNDIAERFDYPSLWAAIDRLMDFTERHVKAQVTYMSAGYTADDALMRPSRLSGQ